MKKIIFSLALLFALTSLPTFADQTSNDPMGNDEEVGTVYDVNGNAVDFDHWHFLGCVRGHMNCRFRADRHGFRFHMTEHDWRRCGRHQLACFAK